MYDNDLAPYDTPDTERHLAERLLDLQRRLELKWAALQPEDGDVTRLSQSRR